MARALWIAVRGGLTWPLGLYVGCAAVAFALSGPEAGFWASLCCVWVWLSEAKDAEIARLHPRATSDWSAYKAGVAANMPTGTDLAALDYALDLSLAATTEAA